MVALVTLDAVKSALHSSDDDDDLIENVYIPAASARIIRHLGAQADAVLDLDSSGDLPSGADAPEDVQAATIMLIGFWYRSPDADEEKNFEDGKLPGPVVALLYPLRDPALA